MKGSGGRKRKYDRVVLAKELEHYIESTEIPIFKEFCVSQKAPHSSLYEMDELKPLISMCTEKKEAALERLSLEGKVNVTQAIFSLKQLGWRDKQEHEVTGAGGGPIQTVDLSGLTIEELRNLAKLDCGAEKVDS